MRSYTIFLDRSTGDLFAYAEIDSLAAWEAVASTDVCRRWWRYLAPLMEVNADSSPAARALDEVFHVEADPPRVKAV